jgi:chromosome segregation ATPase
MLPPSAISETIMKSRRAPAVTGRFRHQFAFAFILTLLLAVCAAAQQPDQNRRVPRMTSDDLMQPTSSSSDETGDGKPADGKAGGKVEGAKGAVSADEASWRERIAQARERAKQTEKAADDTELRVTNLRNELGQSGHGAQYHNQLAADLETTGQQLKDLRKQQHDAEADLKALQEYGREKGFTEAEGPKATTENGKVNEEYYRAKYAEINEEIATAERRVQLYDNRVRDIQQRIVSNGSPGPGRKGGDNFTLAQLQQDKDEAQRNRDKAQEAENKAIAKRDALLEEARRAGVPPGVFR